jgi:hypothetical protein
MFYNNNMPDIAEMSGGRETQTKPDIFPYTRKGTEMSGECCPFPGSCGEGV